MITQKSPHDRVSHAIRQAKVGQPAVVPLPGEPKTAAMVYVAHRMGASHLTAGTGLHNHNILASHQKAGMVPLGRYVVDGTPQQLSLLELEPRLARANHHLKHLQLMHIDSKEMIAGLRGRKRVEVST